MTIAQAKMILDSISPDGIRLRTMQLRYPRIIHSEFMTHRVFSRNARSSRAVPVERMLQEVEQEPFIPQHWGANQKGMQASEECNEPVWYCDFRDGSDCPSKREAAWLFARDQAVTMAKAFAEAGYHKQIVNRLIEPFTFIDVLVSGTDFENFYALRRHEAAEPHMHMLADAMWKCEQASTPELLQPGEWHLPFITIEELVSVVTSHGFTLRNLIKCSVDRCKRISYKPYSSPKELDDEIKGHDDLIRARPVHATPTEHQATPDTYLLREGEHNSLSDVWKYKEQHGNFRGWRQYRKTIPNEAVTG